MSDDINDLSNTVTINEYEINYEEGIEGKTIEAQSFIETQIRPEINDIFDQINQKIELLVAETITRQNLIREEKNKLIMQQKELEESALKKKILGIIQAVDKVLSLGVPLTNKVSEALGKSNVLESFSLDYIVTRKIVKIIPSEITSFVTSIKDEVKIKQELFTKQFQVVDKKLAVVLDIFPASFVKEIKETISHTKIKFDQVIAKGTDIFVSVDKIFTKELKVLLQNKTKILKEQKSDTDQNIEKELSILDDVQKIFKLTETSTDFNREVRNDHVQTHKLSKAIGQVDAKLRKLEQYENDIYQIIIPICRKAENEVMTVEKNLKDKSHVGLDISKWKIQSTLKDVKLLLQKMSEEFQVQEDLKRCIDKLIEGITVMITEYDRI